MDSNKCWQGGRETEASHSWWEWEMVQPLRRPAVVPQNTEQSPYNPAWAPQVTGTPCSHTTRAQTFTSAPLLRVRSGNPSVYRLTEREKAACPHDGTPSSPKKARSADTPRTDLPLCSGREAHRKRPRCAIPLTGNVQKRQVRRDRGCRGLGPGGNGQ